MHSTTHEETQLLFDRLPDASARTKLVEIFRPAANRLASRYRFRGVESDDLRQVAAVGLIKAIDRFDRHRGNRFLTYALPTIDGELKRHFRDAGWGVGVPRAMKELGVASRRAGDELTQHLGRLPTVEEVAEEVDAEPDEVVEANAMWSAFRPDTIDAPGRDGAPSHADRLGANDDELGRVVDLEALAPLLASRTEREQQVLYLRFFREMTQAQIAGVIGVSQMQVSRILSGVLEKLRILLAA